MKNLIIGIVILIIIGAGIYYFASQGNSTAPAASSTAQSSASISIKNFSFSPGELTVKTGTTVTWVNDDNVAHTVTSDSGGLLHSAALAPGASYSATFTDAGTFSYHCSIHPTMKGEIVVKSSDAR